MNYYIKTIYPLVVIAVGVGLMLGGVYQLLEPKLIEAAIIEENNALSKAIQGADKIEKLFYKPSKDTDITNYYKALDKDGNPIGYIFKAANIGYGGAVVSLIGITNRYVANIVIVSMDKETPGLGTKIADSNWLNQFVGKTISEIPLTKEDFAKKGIDAVTSATFSSLAVVKNLKDAYTLYHQHVPEDFLVITTNVITNWSGFTTNFTTNELTNDWDSVSGASQSDYPN